ncbi:MAG: TIGR04552 family protein [Deltaproteobacteria bacterium]|nr:TIGR04552 family protein [Deltaproteobacteria bacterium]MBN2673688.1 TIGR04552 family protein [Deltaproteobacteria bacterium]
MDIVRLSLTNENILDWSRLNFSENDAEKFCENHCLELNNPSDIALIERIRDESIAYLQEEFDFPMPGPIRNASLLELLKTSADASNRHRQFCACTLLKAMHIINHFDAGEARQALTIPDQQLFQIAEARIYKVISGMMADRLPVVEFMGGRKQRASMVTKLLSKDDPLAAQLFDKIRFRVVTATKEDVLPAINYLSKNLFPFNYILSGESYNTLFPFASYVDEHPRLRTIATGQSGPNSQQDSLNPMAQNVHSSPKYQVVHWVADMPVRIEDFKNAYITDGVNPVPRPVIYVRAEIQILDRKTHRINERGHAAHTKYKARQRESVLEKLRVRNNFATVVE